MQVDVMDKRSEGDTGDTPGAKIKVAVAGLGLIGEGAALRLAADPDYEFWGALVRDASKSRDVEPANGLVTENIDELIAGKPDVIFDALPVGDAGRALIEKALGAGISVVSANKQAVAGSLEAFHALANKTGAELFYSASVGGGAPMVETIRSVKGHGDEITGFTAIVNGTVNFILTALAEGTSFEDAIKQAQDAGFAEPDPTADLSGDDARAKISILCYEAFGAEIDQANMTTKPLTAELAADIIADGGVFKQLVTVTKGADGAAQASLDFVKVDSDPFFAGVRAEGNGVRLDLAGGGQATCADLGAGRVPTVGSLFADLARVNVALPPRENR